jgi:hypothetical protein
METDTELAVLENLYGSGKGDPSRPPTQRSLARAAGLSLGMTNVLLNTLFRKGLGDRKARKRPESAVTP